MLKKGQTDEKLNFDWGIKKKYPVLTFGLGNFFFFGLPGPRAFLARAEEATPPLAAFQLFFLGVFSLVNLKNPKVKKVLR